MWAPAPFQSPGIGLGSKVTLTPKSSATRCNINLDIHKWSPISIPSHGPTWYSHWNKKDRPWSTHTFSLQVLEKHAGWIVSLICLITNLRKQLTLGDTITDFLVNNIWGLDTDDVSLPRSWSRGVGNLLQPIRSTIQIWVVTRHQCEISALVPQTSFGEETSSGRRLENVGCSRLEIITVNVTQFSPEPA